MKKLNFTLLIAALTLSSLSAQSCFQQFFNLGKKAYNNRGYDNAINNFEAAILCEDATGNQKQEATKWLKKTNDKKISAIKDERERAIRAQRKAEAAKNDAIKAKQEAEEQQRLAEARGLAILVNQELERQNTQDALTLAFIAYQQTPLASIKKAFGDAVFHHEADSLIGHTESLIGADFSKNGQFVVTYARDKTAKVWEVGTPQSVPLNGHTDWILSAKFSPFEGTLLTTSADKTAKLWTTSGKLIQSFNRHQNDVNGGEFSPDGRFLLTWSRDSTAKLWDIRGSMVADFAQHTAPVLQASFSPDGNFILTRSADKTVKLWDSQGNLLSDQIIHDKHIYQASFSPDGQRILTCSADGTAKLWTQQGTALENLYHAQGVPVPIAIFSHDNRFILTASIDGFIRLWGKNGERIAERKHNDWITDAAFSPKGDRLATVSKDGVAKIWTLRNQDELLPLELKHLDVIHSVHFSPDGEQIITASEDGTVKVWNLNGDILMDQNYQGVTPTSASFSPRGDLLTLTSGREAILCPAPQRVFQKLLRNPPPPFTEEKKKKYGLSEKQLEAFISQEKEENTEETTPQEETEEETFGSSRIENAFNYQKAEKLLTDFQPCRFDREFSIRANNPIRHGDLINIELKFAETTYYHTLYIQPTGSTQWYLAPETRENQRSPNFSFRAQAYHNGKYIVLSRLKRGNWGCLSRPLAEALELKVKP